MGSVPQLDCEALAGHSQQYRLRLLEAFGLALGEGFGPETHLDLLVQYLPGRVPGLPGIARMEGASGELVGRQVDLRTPEGLSHVFRDGVVAEAEVQPVTCKDQSPSPGA